MMRVLLRADGGAGIGTGHVMRCLALADELRARGGDCSFAMRVITGHLVAEVRARGYPVIELPAGDEPAGADLAAWAERRREAPLQAADAAQTLAVLAQHQGPMWDWLVTDHYALGAVWQHALRARAHRVLAIDDLADRALDADVLLDQNPQAPGRYDGLVSARTVKLIGPSHALLRAEFGLARDGLQRNSVAGRRLRVLVSFGGADEQGAALDAVAALAQCGFAADQVVVVAGGRNPHLAALQAACGQALYRCIANTDEMARLMAQADLSIGAGGTSMIERFALGLPGIVVPIAQNQRPGALAAAQAGAIELLEPPVSQRPEALAQALQRLLAQPTQIDRMSAAALGLCDARGAGRVAQVMQRLGLVFVDAAASDAQRLLDWRNAPETRRHSGDGQEIAAQDHYRWFGALLRDPTRRIWIAHVGDTPVGVVRFDSGVSYLPSSPTDSPADASRGQGLVATISIYLVPGLSGRGWGRAVIAGGVAQAHRVWPGLSKVDARISPDNQASLRAFAACGFVPGPMPGVHHLSLQEAPSL